MPFLQVTGVIALSQKETETRGESREFRDIYPYRTGREPTISAPPGARCSGTGTVSYNGHPVRKGEPIHNIGQLPDHPDTTIWVCDRHYELLRRDTAAIKARYQLNPQFSNIEFTEV